MPPDEPQQRTPQPTDTADPADPADTADIENAPDTDAADPYDAADPHDAEDAEDAAAVPTESVRLSALSLPARLVIAGAIGLIGVYAAYHLAMVFLFVAPQNTLSTKYAEALAEYIYPEFEQSWQLFAPNPLQRNVAVEVRAQVREEGSSRVTTTRWISLTALDIERIEHNLFPSHTAQNELRRAWDFFVDSHDEQGQPEGTRGELSEEYLTRIALRHLDEQSEVKLDVADIDRIQIRSATTLVAAPAWSDEETDTSTSYYQLGWWVVTSEDMPQ